MVKTYEVTQPDTVVEKEMQERARTYQKQWLIDEIARLQSILDEFGK